MMEFGNRLKALRTERGLKQADLAGLLGVAPLTIIRWEQGSFEPRLSDLVRLAEILGVSVEELITGKKPGMIEINHGPLLMKVPADETGYAFLRSQVKMHRG